MGQLIKKSTTTQKIPFFMADATNSNTGLTGLSPVVTYSKNGAAFGAAGGTTAEIGNGWYDYIPAAGEADTNGPWLIHATGTGADNWDDSHQVVTDLPGDTVALTAASIQAIWDALTASLTTANSIGKLFVDNITGNTFTRLGAPVGASISVDIAAVKTETAAIKAKTDNLPSDPADASDIAAAFSTVNSTLSTIASYVDTEVAAIKAKTDNLPSDPADASDIAALFATVNSKLDAIDDYVDTEVAAIKAKTDNLPTDPADASDIANSFATVNSTLSTIASYVDFEVAAIKAKTDNLPADTSATLATLAANVGNIPTNPLLDDDVRLDHLDADISSISGAVDIPKNQAFLNFTFLMSDEVTNSPMTGLTVTAERLIDGVGGFVACANAPVELASGVYAIDFDPADTNGDSVVYKFSATGAFTRIFSAYPK